MGGRCRGNYFYGRRRGFRSPSQYFMSQEEEKGGRDAGGITLETPREEKSHNGIGGPGRGGGGGGRMPRQWISSSSRLRLASKLECLLLRTTTGIQRGPQKREDQLRRRLQRGGRSQGRRSLFFSGTRRWPPPFFATTESDFPHRPNEENRRANDEDAGGGKEKGKWNAKGEERGTRRIKRERK